MFHRHAQTHTVRIISVVVACCATSLSTPAAQADAPIARVQQGELRGVERDKVVTFKGIPFAGPPVGANRWRPPADPAAWAGPRNATEAGPACHQFDSPAPLPAGMTESEDCLTLNVWAPSPRSKQPVPVMVWIHGGSNTTGTGAGWFFSGERFASLGVVLVTINYRLGRLGYFAHPALTREDPDGPLGNYGLLDQIAALRWVRTNIAAFGGDPDRVTIAGESSGANSVLALMVSPGARGLFHRAIVQSGYARGLGPQLQRNAPDQPSAPELGGIAFAKAARITGDGPDAARALRALPVAEVKQHWRTPDDPFRAPLIDGVIVPKPILTAFAAGEYAHVPLLIGGNDFEASIEADDWRDPAAALQKTGDPARARILFDPSGKLGPERTAQDLITASYVLEPSRRVAELANQHGSPAYLYLFSYLPSALRGKQPGAPHAGELGYVFGRLPTAPFKSYLFGDLPAANAEDRAFSDRISAYWAAFAKSGDPGKAGGPRWPAYEPNKRTWMQFAPGGPLARPGLHDARMNWLRDLADKPSPTPAGPRAKTAR